jgi:sugar phosphate isomerase/epimerase
MRIDQIALQLYTVRDLAARDLTGTIRQVAEAGYRAVELAGLPAIEAGALASLLRDAGLTAVAAHHPIEEARRDPDALLDRLAALDCSRLVIPSLPAADHASADAVRAAAAELGRLSETAAARGVRVAYHNHAFEFEALDGTTVWDVLTAELPPDVELELDVYWAAIGGHDPVELIERHADRVRLLHMKDVADSPRREDAAPGDGLLPWSRIVDRADQAGVEWYIVEQDEPHDALTGIRRGHDFLGRLAAAAGG